MSVRKGVEGKRERRRLTHEKKKLETVDAKSIQMVSVLSDLVLVDSAKVLYEKSTIKPLSKRKPKRPRMNLKTGWTYPT